LTEQLVDQTESVDQKILLWGGELKAILNYARAKILAGDSDSLRTLESITAERHQQNLLIVPDLATASNQARYTYMLQHAQLQAVFGKTSDALELLDGLLSLSHTGDKNNPQRAQELFLSGIHAKLAKIIVFFEMNSQSGIEQAAPILDGLVDEINAVVLLPLSMEFPALRMHAEALIQTLTLNLTKPMRGKTKNEIAHRLRLLHFIQGLALPEMKAHEKRWIENNELHPDLISELKNQTKESSSIFVLIINTTP